MDQATSPGGLGLPCSPEQALTLYQHLFQCPAGLGQFQAALQQVRKEACCPSQEEGSPGCPPGLELPAALLQMERRRRAQEQLLWDLELLTGAGLGLFWPPQAPFCGLRVQAQAQCAWSQHWESRGRTGGDSVQPDSGLCPQPQTGDSRSEEHQFVEGAQAEGTPAAPGPDKAGSNVDLSVESLGMPTEPTLGCLQEELDPTSSSSTSEELRSSELKDLAQKEASLAQPQTHKLCRPPSRNQGRELVQGTPGPWEMAECQGPPEGLASDLGQDRVESEKLLRMETLQREGEFQDQKERVSQSQREETPQGQNREVTLSQRKKTQQGQRVEAPEGLTEEVSQGQRVEASQDLTEKVSQSQREETPQGQNREVLLSQIKKVCQRQRVEASPGLTEEVSRDQRVEASPGLTEVVVWDQREETPQNQNTKVLQSQKKKTHQSQRVEASQGLAEKVPQGQKEETPLGEGREVPLSHRKTTQQGLIEEVSQGHREEASPGLTEEVFQGQKVEAPDKQREKSSKYQRKTASQGQEKKIPLSLKGNVPQAWQGARGQGPKQPQGYTGPLCPSKDFCSSPGGQRAQPQRGESPDPGIKANIQGGELAPTMANLQGPLPQLPGTVMLEAPSTCSSRQQEPPASLPEAPWPSCGLPGLQGPEGGPQSLEGEMPRDVLGEQRVMAPGPNPSKAAWPRPRDDEMAAATEGLSSAQQETALQRLLELHQEARRRQRQDRERQQLRVLERLSIARNRYSRVHPMRPPLSPAQLLPQEDVEGQRRALREQLQQVHRERTRRLRALRARNTQNFQELLWSPGTEESVPRE